MDVTTTRSPANYPKGLTLCVCLTASSREDMVQVLLDLAGVLGDVRSFRNEMPEGVMCLTGNTRHVH